MSTIARELIVKRLTDSLTAVGYPRHEAERQANMIYDTAGECRKDLRVCAIVSGDCYGPFDNPAEMHEWLKLNYPVCYAQLSYTVGFWKGMP